MWLKFEPNPGPEPKLCGFLFGESAQLGQRERTQGTQLEIKHAKATFCLQAPCVGGSCSRYGCEKNVGEKSAKPGGDDEWSSDSDTDWYEEVSASDAGANLVECLVHLFLEGRISAKNLCVLCW